MTCYTQNIFFCAVCVQNMDVYDILLSKMNLFAVCA